MKSDQISDIFYDEFYPFFNGSFSQDFINCWEKKTKFSLNFNSTNIQSSFIHRSFKHENKIILDHNEKLEFLGDSVLQIYISEKIFKLFIDKKEGELSKIRSALVNEDILSELAVLCGHDDSILLGRGELKEKGFKKSSILSDSFEAVLGAIYLDGGVTEANSFLDSVIQSYEDVNNTEFFNEDLVKTFDSKSQLQELVMKNFKTTPVYKCVEVVEDDKKIFKIEFHINEKVIDSIKHISKKKGMQLLAKKIIKRNIFQEKI